MATLLAAIVGFFCYPLVVGLVGLILSIIYDALSNVYSKISAAVIKKALNQQ